MEKEYFKFVLAYDYGPKVAEEMDLACDEFYELAEEVVKRYQTHCAQNGIDEYYESFQEYMEETSLPTVWEEIVELKRSSSHTTLEDFLGMLDFSYRVYFNNNTNEASLRQRLVADGELSPEDVHKPLIGLVDKQGANWGDIDNDRFLLNGNLVSAIIERLDIYINDSVIKEFETAIRARGLDAWKYNLKEMFLLCKGLGVTDGEVNYTMAELVLSPEMIFVPELYKRRWDRGVDQPFVIKKENIEAALVALLRSTYYAGSPDEKARWHQLVQEDIYEEHQSMLEDIFEDNGYCIGFDREGNVTELSAIYNDQHNELAFFDVFAKYVEKGVFLNLLDAEGTLRHVSFDGSAFVKQKILTKEHSPGSKAPLDAVIASAIESSAKQSGACFTHNKGEREV